MQAVGLKDSEFHRTIQSLVDTKILKKSGEKVYKPSDVISLNKAFVSKRMKFKVVAVLQADTPQQNAETRKMVEDDRKLYLQVRSAAFDCLPFGDLLQHCNRLPLFAS